MFPNTAIKKLAVPVFVFFLLNFILLSFLVAQESKISSHIHTSGTHESSEHMLRDSAFGLEEKIGNSIPLHLSFKDEAGKQVTLGQLVQGPTIIAPVYYRCPNVCNFLQADLARVLPEINKKPGEEYRVISFSFDETETPELAASARDMYFRAMGVAYPEDGWRFLTGDKATIKQLTDAAGFGFRKMENGHFLHPVVVFVINSKGTIVRYLHGTHFLAKDIALALVEAAEGRLGKTIQKVVRFCFSYEAENKTYVFNVLRVTATVVLLTAASFLAFLIFGGKKRKKDS